jgi:Arc/MetJ-type ribon-helix-helix transcriptional regulator
MTVQIAVKLPEELVNQVDGLVVQGVFANRSQAVRAGIEALVASERKREIDKQYREAYPRSPETKSELAEAARIGTQSIHEEPWERWW